MLIPCRALKEFGILSPTPPQVQHIFDNCPLFFFLNSGWGFAFWQSGGGKAINPPPLTTPLTIKENINVIERKMEDAETPGQTEVEQDDDPAYRNNIRFHLVGFFLHIFMPTYTKTV